MSRIEEFTVCVVGVGQIGGSFALALKEQGIGRKIIGVDKEEVVSKTKIKDLALQAMPDLESAIRESDFIFLSTPVLTILDLLPRIATWMRPEAILLDSGSTKKRICLLMRKHPERILIGGHPMTGTEKEGFDAATPSLFKNKIFSFTFPTGKSREGKGTVLKILEKIGSLPLEIDAERHDEIVSLTSHLPYVLSLALSHLARDFMEKEPLLGDFIAGGFLGASRLSLTPVEMGRGILATNSSRILQMMEAFSKSLKRIKSLIKDDNAILDFLTATRHFQTDLKEKR